MKILWLSAIQLPATLQNKGEKPIVTGGWVNAMVNELIKKDEISSINIVSVHNGNSIEKLQNGKIIYTLIPSSNGIFKYDRNLYKQLRNVILDYNPDIIDVQGIEFFLVKSLYNLHLNIPILLTIQGLASEIYKHSVAGISFKSALSYRTLRNTILFDGIFERKLKYKKRGKNEIKILKYTNSICGRTDWDKSHTLKYNNNSRYYHCDRILRPAFYSSPKWDITQIDRQSLFMTQSRIPIKGLHILLEALYLLKDKFPDVKLYIGGKDLSNNTGLRNILAQTDYQRYINSLIKKFDLTKRVNFTGFLNEEQVIEKLFKSHIFVLPSFIENSPNALAEAQMIGTPAIASLVGGNANYIRDKLTGLLYNSGDPVILASKIESILVDDRFAQILSRNEIEIATKRHDQERNSDTLIKIYKEITQKYKKL